MVVEKSKKKKSNNLNLGNDLISKVQKSEKPKWCTRILQLVIKKQQYEMHVMNKIDLMAVY